MKLNVICLEHSGGVCFGKLEYRRGEAVLLEERSCRSMVEFSRLSDRISDVLNNIKPYRNAQTIVVGGINDAETIELNMPRLHRSELLEGLEYELPCHLPGDFDDMVWYGRIIPEVKCPDGEMKIRCCAFSVKSWELLIQELSAAGCRFDYWAHPFVEAMAVSGNEELYCPENEPDFIMSLDPETGCSDILPAVWKNDDGGLLHDNFLRTTGAMAVAERFFKDSGKGAIRALSSPPHLKIRRSRFLQTAAVFLFLATVVLGSLGVIMRMQERQRHYEAVSSALSMAEDKLMRQRKKNIKNLKLQKHFQDLFKRFDECSLGPGEGLAGFAGLLPKDIYLTDYAGYSGKINLTLKNGGGNSDGFNELKRSPTIVPSSVRKRRNRDGSQYIYMTLESKGGKSAQKNLP